MKSIEGGDTVTIPQNRIAEIQKVEEAIKKRVCIGNQVSLTHLSESL